MLIFLFCPVAARGNKQAMNISDRGLGEQQEATRRLHSGLAGGLLRQVQHEGQLRRRRRLRVVHVRRRPVGLQLAG